jgi:metal-dependent amidase/aminoacylase/carboxypeptidase family protein
LIEQGHVLEEVDAALSLHVYPQLPVGQIGFRPGVMLGYSDRFTVHIHGVGVHTSRPHQTVDAVAVQVYQALQYLVSRENDPLHLFVITIGALHAGTVANVIPNDATLLGTVRSLDPKSIHICRSALSVWLLVFATPPERTTPSSLYAAISPW